MQNNFQPGPSLQQELQNFLAYHNLSLLSQNLRRLFIDYLDYELRTAVPLYFDEFLYPFNCLLDLLDAAAQELQATPPVAEGEKEESSRPNATTQEKIIAFITASLSPEKIFILHSEPSYFDLLVVIPETSKTSFSQYEQVVALASIDDVEIHVSLHKTLTLQQQLQEGHIFYCLACGKQNLVYDNNPAIFLQSNKAVLQQLVIKANETFKAAHKKAESFLQGASNFYGENDLVMAAFMLQQAVELTLRGLILALSGNCHKTHNFKELKRQLKRYLPALQYIFSNVEGEELRLSNLLEKAYLDSRYAPGFTITDNDLALLTTGAEELHTNAENLLQAQLESLTQTINSI